MSADIELSMHGGETLSVEIDADSSVQEGPWVTMYSDADGQDFYVNLTLAEAGLLYDRLGYLTGRFEELALLDNV